MKISKFKFFRGVKHYPSITPPHNNINVGISNNFISFIDNMTLEQILSVTRGTLSQQQSEYIDCRINHITIQI
jgi:hypothetical protein